MTAPIIPSNLSVAYNSDYYANEIIITAGDTTHTGFRIYRYEGEQYGWEQVDELETTDVSATLYMGGAQDEGKPWGVTAFNADGESPRLEINVATPQATIANFSAARTATPGEVALTWEWSGDSQTVYLFTASEYDASSGNWTDKGNVDAQALGALIADIPRFETWVIRLYDTNSTYQQTPLAEFTLQPAAHETSAPANISGSISALDRIIIEFDPVAWENEPDFLYRFTFQRGTDAPITMDKAWGVLTTGDGRRQLYDQLIGLTAENANEWSVTIQGVSSLGTGDTSAPFVLQPEAASALLSFSMDDTAQISWVFDDWQNAVPLEVETRIDGGPWLPTFVTDESRTNAELYGDDCIVGDDWSGGTLGLVHWHWPFDGQPHTVEARARIQGTSNPWLYSEAQEIPLRSLYNPVASWGTVSFNGANGPQALPAPTITLQRPDYYDGYALAVAIDGGPEIPWRDLDFSTVYRTSVTPMDFVALADAEQRDGGEHAVSLFLDVIQEGETVHSYDFGVTNVVIPLGDDLAPAPPVWSAKVFLPEDGASTAAVLHLETAARVLMDIAAVVEVDGVTVPSSEIAVTVYAQALTTARYHIAIPAADGYTHVIRCTLTLTSPITGESTTQATPAVSFLREVAKPATPTAITATLLRQAADGLPDQVQLDWIADTLVQLLAIIDGRTRIIAYGDSSEHTLRLENIANRLPRDGELHSIRFGVRGYQAGRVGDARLSASVDLSAYAPLPEPEPVPITLFSDLLADVATSAGVTSDTAEIIIRNGLRQIKAVVAKGGSVSLDYFGEYSAAWSNEVRVPKFKIGDAFKSGVLQGVVIP